VNTDENWSFSISALVAGSTWLAPSRFSGATPELSHFLDFTNVNRFLDLSSVTMSLTYVSWAVLHCFLASCWIDLYFFQSSSDFMSLAFL